MVGTDYRDSGIDYRGPVQCERHLGNMDWLMKSSALSQGSMKALVRRSLCTCDGLLLSLMSSPPADPFFFTGGSFAMLVCLDPLVSSLLLSVALYVTFFGAWELLSFCSILGSWNWLLFLSDKETCRILISFGHASLMVVDVPRGKYDNLRPAYPKVFTSNLCLLIARHANPHSLRVCHTHFGSFSTSHSLILVMFVWCKIMHFKQSTKNLLVTLWTLFIKLRPQLP